MITVNGSGRSFGIFFVELLKEFNATSSIVSFVLGAQSMAYSLSGKDSTIPNQNTGVISGFV